MTKPDQFTLAFCGIALALAVFQTIRDHLRHRAWRKKTKRHRDLWN